MPQDENAAEELGLEDIFVGADTYEDDAPEGGVDYGDDLEPAPEADVKADAEPAPEPEPEPEPKPEPEPEPAAEAEADVKADAEPEPEPEPKPTTDQRIPKERFDNVNERRKAAERELEELRAQQQVQAQAQQGDFDFDAKEREYMEAVVDGEFDKAGAIRNEIRTAEQTRYEAAAQQQALANQTATKESIAFDKTVASLQDEFNEFNENHENYSPDLVDEALMLYEGFIGKGLSMSQSIEKAARYVAKMNDLTSNTAVSEAAPEVPEVPEEPAAKPTDPKSMKEKVEAAGNQPPDMGGAANTEDAMDVSSMTEEEFDALPESKKAQLRGDFV